jgi:hypothetical protein
MRRLMSVPGVNLHTAATFMAWVGDIGRFSSARKLVSYLGLDPKVRQSGTEPVRYGHISKEGASEARHMLCEAAWVVVRYPSPLRAFGQRIAARRGAGIATVAVARKLVVLFWHLLTKEEDYAFERASLTQRKLRRLELPVGAERRRSGGRPSAALPHSRRGSRRSWSSPARRKPPTSDSSRTGNRLRTRARAGHRDAHPQAVRAPSSAAGRRSQTLRFSSSSPTPSETLASSSPRVQENLTFIRRAMQQRRAGSLCAQAARHQSAHRAPKERSNGRFGAGGETRFKRSPGTPRILTANDNRAAN